MENIKEKRLIKKDFVSTPSTRGLRGHQSVRATFRLSEECIDTIRILSAHLGIKQKSIFDHLLEDVQTLKEMAHELANMEFNREDRVQKSFVINRRSLSYLNKISKNHNTSRDTLVEYSVRQLLPIIANERKNHKKRKELLVEISDHFNRGKTLLTKAEKALNRVDPIVNNLKAVMAAYKNALDDISSYIEKGKMIEEFKPD